MTDAQRVALDVDAGIARLRLCAADRRNAIDPAFVDELRAAVLALRTDPSIRAVLVTADGPAFTVGGDLRHFATNADDIATALQAMVPPFHEALFGLAAVNAPVVAAVQGAAAGGGLGIAWCADVLIAADDAVFATGFARLALSGDGASSWWLPRLIGLRRAQEVLLRDRVIRGAEALEWGIATEVVPAAELHERAETVAAEFAAGPTAALAQMRHLLRQSATRSLGDQLEAETHSIIECGRSAEAREGIVSFLERRVPVFGDQPQGGSNG